MSESILDQFMKRYSEDVAKADTSQPTGSIPMNEEMKAVYVEKLNELRNNENSPEAVYQRRMQEMVKMTEETLIESGKISNVAVHGIFVRKAYCPECGKEIVCNAPTMFNPYTQEKVCRYTCPECKKVYNLEYAYPRFVLLDENGNELMAFGL
ncbi:MAG: hypothetical protein LUD72_00090 [Bacteroidales bacterium]|nr:hypothetical protein [Bacteroidales bacterium]